MRELFYSVDGLDGKDLSRMRMIVDKDAFRAFVASLPSACFWFQLDYFDQEAVDMAVWGETIIQWCGNANTSYTFCVGYPEPEGIISIPTSLIDSYILARMHELTTFDVVLFCTTGTTYQAPPTRTVVYDKDKLDKKCCMFGKYASIEDRTPIIDACAERGLSCVVVRAMRMDKEGKQAYPSNYNWESEYRVPYIYL
jgi:hypothetical protein